MVVNNKILLVRGGLKSKSLLSLPIRRNTSRYGSFGCGNSRFFASVSATEKLISSRNGGSSSTTTSATSAAASVATAAGLLLAASVASTVDCDDGHNNNKNNSLTPASVATENLMDLINSHIIDDENNEDEDETNNNNNYPIYTAEQVAVNNGENGKPIWMTYGGVVYDVTEFISNHPGGSERILLAAGGPIEPYWHTYRQHFASDLPIRLMEHMVIGRLADVDQEAIDEQMDVLYETSVDPFENEPVRHKALRVHSEQSMNAETPSQLLTQNYLTPNSLFYIRHHHPVPFLTTEQVQNYQLEIDLSALDNANDNDDDDDDNTLQKKRIVKISLDDLKRMPKTNVTATLQCSGNRRSGFNKFHRTSGTSWGQGAISTAKWTGVRLSDILKFAGLDDPILAQEKYGIQHVRMFSLDGMSASVGIEKVMNPYGDCIIAYEMNGCILPRDHGYPLRVSF